MRNGLSGLARAMLLAPAISTAGCGFSGSDGNGGTGASSGATSDTGGAAGTGGAVGVGGGVSTGGAVGSGGVGTAGVAGTGGCSSGVDPITSLCGTTSLSALTPAEATQLCDDTYAYFGSTISNDVACKWKGLSFAISSSAPTEDQLRANCTSKESSCLLDPATALANNPGCNSFPANCVATVADYSACVQERAAGFTQTVSGIQDCDVLTFDGLNPVWDALGALPTPTCTFDATCAGLYPPNPLY
jgi:hypothetical protein